MTPAVFGVDALAGMLMMWDVGIDEAVVVDAGDGLSCLPLFSTRAKLETCSSELGLAYGKIRQVDDPEAFVADVHRAGKRIIIDPAKDKNGRITYLLIRDFSS